MRNNKWNLALALLCSFLFAGSALAQGTATINLYRDGTSLNGGPEIPTGTSFQLPPVGQTMTVNNKEYHSVFTHNSGVGNFFNDDPRNPAAGQKDEVVLTIKRTAVNAVEVGGDLKGFSLPSYADLYPRGDGPKFRFTAEWNVINGEVKLAIRDAYIVFGYLEVNNHASRGVSIPSAFGERFDLPGKVWDIPNGPLVRFGAQDGPATCQTRSATYTIIRFERNTNPGIVSIFEFSVTP